MRDQATNCIPYLDGWRGLAIISVLACHFSSHPALGWLGSFGVQLFFALSGYLMGDLLFLKKVGIDDFFVHRFSRVIPTFVLFVTAMYFHAQYFQARPYAVPGDELLATFAFLRTYLPIDSGIWSGKWPIGNLWSLNVEEHSYVFLAAIACLARRTPQLASVLLMAAVAVIVGCCLYYPRHLPVGASAWQLRSECAALALAAAAAIGELRHLAGPSRLNKVPSLLPILLVVIAVAGMSTFPGRGGITIFAPLCLAVAINYFHVVPKVVKRFLSNPAFRWFGSCSFSLYLWQQPFYAAASANLIPRPVACSLAITLGALSFYLFEHPLRIRLNRAWARRRGKHRPALDAAPAAIGKAASRP
jgi:peptidoglycan/LPS O-acetylase OafA/YrhL